ncbi:MAG: hypothetical protein QGG01_04975, partial [Roseibacillus sp.]|nr:hypothetical protein [Roseibacillus sp.]
MIAFLDLQANRPAVIRGKGIELGGELEGFVVHGVERETNEILLCYFRNGQDGTPLLSFILLLGDSNAGDKKRGATD